MRDMHNNNNLTCDRKACRLLCFALHGEMSTSIAMAHARRISPILSPRRLYVCKRPLQDASGKPKTKA